MGTTVTATATRAVVGFKAGAFAAASFAARGEVLSTFLIVVLIYVGWGVARRAALGVWGWALREAKLWDELDRKRPEARGRGRDRERRKGPR